MKKTLLFITALLFCSFAFAQQGEIIYTDFDPDLTLVQGINSNDSIMLDIDYDDVYDLKFGLVYYHFEFPVYTALNGWSICQVNDSTDLTTDTLFWLPYIDYGFTNYFVLKKVVGENCYYGWLYTYDGQTKNNKGTKAGTLFIDRMAYCTIPNYPLRAGQTSLTDDILENAAAAFAPLHPNPTTGQVTIMGQDLKAAVVFNTLGQQVATATGEGETLHIDIANLPAGVYFVNVTDGEGRKCVKKVIKE